MSPLLLRVLGVILIVVAIWAMINRKVPAGARGLRSNFYTKQDNPFLYYLFVCVYLLIGALVLLNSF